MSPSKNSKLLLVVDEETIKFFSPGQDILLATTEKDYCNSLAKLANQDFKVVMLAELNWPGKQVSDFRGFDLTVELRRKHKIYAPVILLSTFPKVFFENLARKNFKYQILFGRGTYFLELQEVETKLQDTLSSASPINPVVLTDLNEMLLNLKGYVIDRLTHDLKPGVTEEHLRDVLNEISQYLDEESTKALSWNEITDNLLESLNNPPEFYKHKDALLLNCEQELVSPGNDPEKLQKKRHRILVLEDDHAFASHIQQQLSPFFEELIIVNNSSDAIDIINNDVTNSITGIVTDWRLYSDEHKRYWQIQGYEVLDHAAKTRFMALFALTSLSDKNVHRIRNMLKFSIHLFKKGYLLEEKSNMQWSMLADIIHQKCDEVLDVLSSQPTGSAWIHLENAYRQARNSEWKVFENSVSGEASRIFQYYFTAIEKREYTNVFSVAEMGFTLKSNLKNILIIRRVFLGIYFSLLKSNIYLQDIRPARLLGTGETTDTELKHHSIDTYSLLRKDWWNDNAAGQESVNIEDTWEKFEQRVKNLRGVLCIEMATLPIKGLLPEEKGWLLQNGIDYSFQFNYWSTD